MFQPDTRYIQSGAQHQAGPLSKLLRIASAQTNALTMIAQLRQPFAQCRHSCTKASETPNRHRTPSLASTSYFETETNVEAGGQKRSSFDTYSTASSTSLSLSTGSFATCTEEEKSRLQPHSRVPSAARKVKEDMSRLRKMLRVRRRRRNQSGQRIQSRDVDIPRSRTPRTQRKFSAPKTCAINASSFLVLLSASTLAWPW